MSTAPTENRRLRIAIATLGRFHVLDLARELASLGHDVKFYSYVPRSRARRFGLPAECHVSLLPILFPLVGMRRLLPERARTWLDRWLHYAANAAVMLRLRPCDVFICMSGVYLEALRHARKKYGARVYLERGSRHILSQREILERIPHAAVPPGYKVSRELQGYTEADRIVVPSMHVEESFVSHGVAKTRLFRNPYGVDLSMFQPTQVAPGLAPTVLFVGTWSLRKGVDVLVEAMARMPELHLLHVGPIGDAPFPDGPRFAHYDAVPQWRLAEFYARAHVFVHASREEGLSLVLAQALACGLPVVCTTRTGGEDLIGHLAHPQFMAVIPPDDAGALVVAAREMLGRALTLRGKRHVLTDAGRQALTWTAYAGRYSHELTAARVE